MEVSIASFVVLLGLILLGRSLGSASIVGLIASCAFGSTAIVTLTALGGSSPLIYNVFAVFIIISAVARRASFRDLANAYTVTWVPWVVSGLVVYACGSALIMPRLFADQTSTFAVSPKGFVEVALSPTPGNLLQTIYLVLFALTFLALRMSSFRADSPRLMCKGFFAWATIIAASGILDVAAKNAGLGDVMSSLRTANYAFLTNDATSGFARVNGTFSEASAFAGSALGALAFTYTYWRGSGSRGALLLTVLLIMLLICSTSSTAYVGLMIMGSMWAISTTWSLVRGKDVWSSAVASLLVVLAVTLAIIVMMTTPDTVESAQKLMQTTLIDKASSESGLERSYMNQVSVQNLFDTWGLGVGYGSSRSSSWFLAMLSQLGVAGTLLQLLLLIPLLRGPSNSARRGVPQRVVILHEALQACALALFLGQTISGTNANPGILIFIALAGVEACRAQMTNSSSVDKHSSTPPVSRGPASQVKRLNWRVNRNHRPGSFHDQSA